MGEFTLMMVVIEPIAFTRPEEFVNLQGLLVRSSKRFGISSVQFSSLVTSLTGNFIQFSLRHSGQVPPFSSVQFSSFSSFYELFRRDTEPEPPKPAYFGRSWI